MHEHDTEEWVDFARRTCDPKLSWLEGALKEKGIPSQRAPYESWHAPILQVRRKDLDAAWDVLLPDDDVPDDDLRYDTWKKEAALTPSAIMLVSNGEAIGMASDVTVFPPSRFLERSLRVMVSTMRTMRAISPGEQGLSLRQGEKVLAESLTLIKAKYGSSDGKTHLYEDVKFIGRIASGE